MRAISLLLLGLLALFSLVSYLVVSTRVGAQHRDAQLINVAGRQRMYSQRVALLSSLLVDTEPDQQDSLRSDLRQTVSQMETAQSQLTNPFSEVYPPGTREEDVRALYFGASALDSQVRTFIAAAYRLLETPRNRLNRQNAAYLTVEQAAQGSLLPALDAVVTIDGLNVQSRLLQFDKIALASLLLTLFTLGGVGAGVLFPLMRRQDRATRALQEEKNFVQQVMDNMGQGLGITGPDYRYSYVNPAYAQLVGRTPESMIGMSPLDIIVPAEHGRVEAVRAERRAGRTTEQNVTFQRPDGSSVQTLTVVVPHVTALGTGGIAVITDLTEQIRAEQQLRQQDLMYRTMAANFPDGALTLFGHDLRYILADGSGLQSVGLTPKMLEGHLPTEVLPHWLGTLLEGDYRAALQGAHRERELDLGGRTLMVKTLPLRATDLSEPVPQLGPVSELGPVPEVRSDAGALEGEEGPPGLEDSGGHIFGGVSIVLDITERRQAERDLVRASAYTSALLETSRLAQSDQASEELALSVASVIGKAADIDLSVLLVLEDDALRVVSVWHRVADDPTTELFRTELIQGVKRKDSVTWRTIQSQDALFIDDYPASPNAYAPYTALGLKSAALLPLNVIGEKPYLYMATRLTSALPWSAADRELFQAAARSMQINLERHNHLLELERAALIDALTGLSNRRAFERDLERELERSKRSGEPVGVLMVDLDGLKQINDREGHGRGDALLVSFAQTLSASLRNEDQVYRLGGDEYAAIVSRAGTAAAESLESRVRWAVDQTRMAGFPDVDASSGLAFAPDEVRQASDLLRRADERMYAQKQEHRQARRLRERSADEPLPQIS
ncbi:diguanylate cyclase domain-containing protein [Deinococcus altitudinis]|uniref:diguanylate cyclase domain-containing protein n=1 Tax=Deinococcus altitudinis TaxID=468914 RepID=UPI003891BF72